jgi:hypothetical protein
MGLNVRGIGFFPGILARFGAGVVPACAPLSGSVDAYGVAARVTTVIAARVTLGAIGRTRGTRAGRKARSGHIGYGRSDIGNGRW